MVRSAEISGSRVDLQFDQVGSWQSAGAGGKVLCGDLTWLRP